ncbi:UNVERIFIED_CONTAM: 1-aminocyclopropane-1-carboxylate oxidase 5 [Sesamum latifolium]|uniref:1-aminocyclopropane-1-carboxylate oxidase 5 n=1 Tax=Sesamum latifolium TaxID=2727402 RepID=A0AAW2S1S0_9LAMI
MGIPVVDFSKVDGKERADTLALIDHYCKEWGFFQLINHGISEELLDKVKKVATECYKLEREASFKNSKPVKLLNELLGKKNDEKVENVDWEDVFLLSDENDEEWPSKTLGFNNSAFFGTKVSHLSPCPHPEKVNALRAHTDAGGVVLLFQDDEVKGLQMLKDGVWADVQPLKKYINTGDQIEVEQWEVQEYFTSSCAPNRWAKEVNCFILQSITQGNHSTCSTIAVPKWRTRASATKYPKFVFGDYMSVYLEQNFNLKPRFRRKSAVRV